MMSTDWSAAQAIWMRVAELGILDILLLVIAIMLIVIAVRVGRLVKELRGVKEYLSFCWSDSKDDCR